jgi:hypothetical protein
MSSLEDITIAIAKRQKTEEASGKEEARQRQIESGRCKVIPHPALAQHKPFRAERLIEQHSLFVANSYRHDSFERTWTIEDPLTKEQIEKHLLVGKIDPSSKERGSGVLRQVHQDAFYKLLRLWAERGYPLLEQEKTTYGFIKMTAYEMANAICGDDNKRAYVRTKELLHQMRSIPVRLEVNYLDRIDECDRDTFTLLEGVSWKEKRVSRKTGRPLPGGESTVTVLFSDFVTKGFMNNRLKNLLWGPYEALRAPSRGRKNETACLLYTYLDGQLATKDTYHVKLEALSDWFQLGTYDRKSARKRRVEPSVKALDGSPILSGKYRMRVWLRESVDKTDYVLEAKKEPMAGKH